MTNDDYEFPGMVPTANGRKIGKWRIGPFFQLNGYTLRYRCVGFVAVRPDGEYLTESIIHGIGETPVEMLRLFRDLDEALRVVRPMAARARIRAI